MVNNRYCIDCGKLLNKYGMSVRCGSCASKENQKKQGHRSLENRVCMDCGQKLLSHGKPIRCHSCAGKIGGYKKGNYPAVPFQKNNQLGKTNKGRILTEKHKNNIRNALAGHHIWYEDNEGNPTNKGIWLIHNKLHGQITRLMQHNHWTDNRRYLAG